MMLTLEEMSSEYRESLWARFDVKVRRGAEGECWLWLASCDNTGLPQVGGVCNGKKWMARAHMLAWVRTNGPVPAGRLVSRSCGEKRCVNPMHLLLITDQERTQAALAAQPRPTRDNDRVRFMEYVRKAKSGCWIWTGGIQGAGSYGFFWLDKKLIGAHRASYVLFKEDIQLSRIDTIMHSCDDRRCVNPEHLTRGTPTSNMEDRFAKGRVSRALELGEVPPEVTELVLAEYTDEMERLATKHNISIEVLFDLVGGGTK